MELYQLEYLVAIEENKTILKTAEQLHVTQPSITKAIKKLEDEFGFPLFDRVKNRLILNDYGKIAVQHAKKVLSEVNALKQETDALYASSNTLSIGTIAPAPLWGFTSLTSQPVHKQLYEDIEKLLTDFKKHLYSMIIIDYPINDDALNCQKICDEQLYIAVNDTHPLALKKSVTFEDINGYNFLQLKNVGYWYELTKEKLNLSKFLIQEDVETYHILCQSTDLPIFRTNLTIPYFKDKEDKVYIPITNTEATLSFYGIYHKKDKNRYNNLFQHIDDIDWAKAYHYTRIESK